MGDDHGMRGATGVRVVVGRAHMFSLFRNYPEGTGNPLKRFKQGLDGMWFVFWKNPFGPGREQVGG